MDKQKLMEKEFKTDKREKIHCNVSSYPRWYISDSGF